MTDHERALAALSAMEAKASEATEGPWQATDVRRFGCEDCDGDVPSDGYVPEVQVTTGGDPAYLVARVATDPQPQNGTFIASVRTDAPRAYAAIRAVLELHTPWGIYDACGHDHQSTDEPGVIDVEDVGMTCEEGRAQTVCRHCALFEDEPDENTCEHEWPCPTVRTITEKLAGEEGR